MISLHSTGSPAETNAAYTLLAIIADPDAAKKRLDELVSEKTAAQEAMDGARATTEEAKTVRKEAVAKLAEATRLHADMTANHEIRTKQLDERHEFLVAKDTRLTNYEAAVAAREKELGEPLAAREQAIANREAAAEKREAALDELHAQLEKAKEVLDLRAKKMLDAVK